VKQFTQTSLHSLSNFSTIHEQGRRGDGISLARSLQQDWRSVQKSVVEPILWRCDMYFFNREGTLCHILEDEESGKAPAPCGSQASRAELIRFRSGKATTHIVAEKPAGIPLCKHCQKAEA
jgi:hypothetical protein